MYFFDLSRFILPKLLQNNILYPSLASSKIQLGIINIDIDCKF
jgi:hypothetical protein